MEKKRILDATCGGRSIWFDKYNPDAIYCDKRSETINGQWKSSQRTIEISPDVVCDFTNLPFDDESFYMVVFDPPHLDNVGYTSWLYAKYGRLEGNWDKMIHDGFWECMRVLKPNGTLIFKWSEIRFPVSKIVDAIGVKPLFGHRSGKKMNTHWMCFIKDETQQSHDIVSLGDENETN